MRGTPPSNLYNTGTRRAGFWRMEMDSGKKAIMKNTVQVNLQ